MARIRTIKPEFFTSDDIVSMSPLARLFYVSLWCEADREGRLAWNVNTLKMRYLPGDDADINEVAGELIERGHVRLYEVDDKTYAVLPTFAQHQVINNREKPSAIPEPTDDSFCDATFARESGVKAEGKERKEGKGREGNGKSRASTATQPQPAKPTFDWDSGKIIDLPEPMIDKWQQAYPAIDVRKEIARAEAWVMANPKNAKSDYVRFLNGWLSRAQDRAPRAGPGSVPLSERNRQAVQDHLAHRAQGPDTSWIIPDDDSIIDMETTK